MIHDIKLKNSSDAIIPVGARENDYVLQSVDWGTAKVNPITVLYFPAEASEELEAAEWEPRPILIVGYVIGNSEADILTKRNALEDFLEVQGETKLLYNGYELTFYPIKAVKFAITEQENNEVLCQFTIEGECTDPMWHNTNTATSQRGVLFPMFHFPMTFSNVVFGHQLLADEFAVNYTGTVPAAPIIRITSPGTLSGLTIRATQENHEQIFVMDETWVSGINSEITIDTEKQTVKTGTGHVDVTEHILPVSQWIWLHPGQTILSFSYLGTEPINVEIETNTDPQFEVQTI